MGKMKGLVCTLLLCSLVGALASSSNVEAGEGQEVKGHYLRGEMVEGEKLKFCEPPPKDYPPLRLPFSRLFSSLFTYPRLFSSLLSSGLQILSVLAQT
jgi:hypothetical protein